MIINPSTIFFVLSVTTGSIGCFIQQPYSFANFFIYSIAVFIFLIILSCIGLVIYVLQFSHYSVFGERHNKANRSILRNFPTLRSKIPFVSLAKGLPTSIESMNSLARSLKLREGFLVVKRDDLSGPYGGNKTRKLEFLLGHLLEKNDSEVISFGFAGSNYAVATAYYSAKLGLKSSFYLLRQPKADYVRHNLLSLLGIGAKVIHCESTAGIVMSLVPTLLSRFLSGQDIPSVLPPGGSNSLGTIGYINAALELADQVNSGIIPAPSRIYIALGSGGSGAGLAIGLSIAGLSETTVIGVRVVPASIFSDDKFRSLIPETMKLLSSADSKSFSKERVSSLIVAAQRCYTIRDGYVGVGYAHHTQSATDAAKLIFDTEHIILDPTYTSKALAALIDDVHSGNVPAKTSGPLMFWNTYNSHDMSSIGKTDYHELPLEFHHYFG